MRSSIQPRRVPINRRSGSAQSERPPQFPKQADSWAPSLQLALKERQACSCRASWSNSSWQQTKGATWVLTPRDISCQLQYCSHSSIFDSRQFSQNSNPAISCPSCPCHSRLQSHCYNYPYSAPIFLALYRKTDINCVSTHKMLKYSKIQSF